MSPTGFKPAIPAIERPWTGRGHRSQSAQPLGLAQLNKLFDLNLGIPYIFSLPYFLSVVIFFSQITARKTYNA
jgi:hypothetical protein